jgi:uncharacterized protein YggT (Ycf19 family)
MDPLCHVYGVIYYILNAYLLVMLIYALVSWIPVRRIIPPLGGFDLSFLIVILVIQYVNNSIVRQYSCSAF